MDLPPSLKAIQHYLKTAAEHDKRDPVVSYYCRLHAMQRGMVIDKASPESRKFLLGLMDQLEGTKQNMKTDEIHNEMVGQAHVENYALQLFLYADTEDRAGRFGKNVVKSFYTSWLLFDVLTQFGELSEDIESHRKYSKWKAAYIHNCLKNGETPQSGPMADEDDPTGAMGGEAPGPSSAMPGPSGGHSSHMPTQPALPYPGDNPYPHVPPTTPAEPPTAAPRPRPAAAPTPQQQWQPPAASGNVQLNTDHYQRAMKLCKFASSALQYEDSAEAVKNLTKALNLLQTGQEG